MTIPNNQSLSPNVNRSWTAFACLVSIGLCLAYAWFRPSLPPWWNRHGGGIPYVLFWIALGFTVAPYRRCILPVVVVSVGMTSGLEFLQLWKPDWLMEVRGTPFGAALLGSGFDWNDFPPYFIGGALGIVMLVLITACSTRSSVRCDRQ